MSLLLCCRYCNSVFLNICLAYICGLLLCLLPPALMRLSNLFGCGSVGLLVQSPSDASVAEIPQGDLDTAKLYGKRVADITARLKG